MKKKGIIWIIVIILVIGLALLFLLKESKTNTLENEFSTSAKDYFNNYISIGTGANAYKVSLKMLKESNEEGLTEYNLKSFKSCNEEKTFAMVSFNYKTGKAVKAVVTLDCKN